VEHSAAADETRYHAATLSAAGEYHTMHVLLTRHSIPLEFVAQGKLMVVNVKLLAAAVAAVLNLILIVFVSLRSRRHIVYRSFLLISFCLLMWNLRVIISGLVQLDNNDSFYAVLVTQVFYPMVSVCLYILPVAALQFTLSFIKAESRLSEYLVKIAYILAFLLSFLYVSELIPNWHNDRIFWAFFLPVFLTSLVFAGRAYLQSRRPLERTRLGLLLVAGTIGVAGAIAEDILVASGFNAKGLGNIANATYSFLVALCLFSHRLFDVRITMRRIAGFASAALIVVAVAYVTSELLKLSTPMPYVYVFITVLVLLIFGRRLVPLIEHVLFKKSTALHQSIDGVRLTLDRARNTTDLLRLASGILIQDLGIDRCLCIAFDEITQRYQCHWPINAANFHTDVYEPIDNIAKWMAARSSTEPLIYDEMHHELSFAANEGKYTKELLAVMNDIENLGYEACLPLLSETKLEGMMLLSGKKNRRAFTDSDIRFMKLLAYNSTLWLQHLSMLEKISELETLAGLGEMAAHIAHEVKNPLTIIRSSAQLMQSRQQNRENAEMIIQECDRLSRVVSKLVDLSRPPAPHPQSIEIEKTIKAWVDEIMQVRQSKNLKIEIEAEAGVSSVIFDLNHLKQVFTNLFLNAVEAMHGNGQIRISLERTQDMVQLAISDSGPGFRQEQRSNLFKLFYTTKPAGTGLGLPITHRLLELNNGTIDIESLPGKGCTVVIKLPME
jgi:two-component system sensor histidine kinase HydH